MKNIVVFDLETRRSFQEVGGRHNIPRLGLSVAVTYSTADSEYQHYTEETVAELIEELKAADLVVGPIAVTLFFKGGRVSPKMVGPVIELALRGIGPAR